MTSKHVVGNVFAATAVLRCGRFVSGTRLGCSSGKIIIPTLPTSGVVERNLGSFSSTSALGRGSSEYYENKRMDPAVGQFLGGDASATLRRQQQLEHFRNATEDAAVRIWRDSKSHIRRQEKLVQDIGVEGAVRELLQPTQISFRQELRQRPLDRGILEEIYKGLHGRRIERQLKRGVSWEHWITKGDGTAPVFTASRKAQQTFAFGGNIKVVAKATHPKQFPVMAMGGGYESSNGVFAMGESQRLVPEVAFVGRTSSGKSSLVNAIVNAMVAPYGHLQGTTSSVNFYNIADKIVLVDCPGYGYYNPMETPHLDAENAVASMRAYLTSCSRCVDEKQAVAGTGRINIAERAAKDKAAKHGNRSRIRAPGVPRPIKRVFVCVSARGMQHSDLAYLDHLETLSLPFSVVLTKTDAAPIRFLARLADHTRCQLVHYKNCKELLLTSSLRLAGIDKMQSLIGSMALGEDKLHGATTDFSAIV
ncbi:50S ribosome-binding GTPase [Trypanosoma brucei equiperdum]|uniref:50S ribosome-binding GTPase n=1 Tax=Trypanosoma brucei equiperdum TaxID=630700 RepID=A0A3L6L2T2_9TRYP|nr:50S ribosome-binding GTPase [Trypanosoma brucei equiperdum]